jgi:hypothetical protein
MCSRSWFQQDGAPPHIAKIVKATLNANFKDHVISRGFSFVCPARIPDLNPLDFFLWRYLKQKVYKKQTYATH